MSLIRVEKTSRPTRAAEMSWQGSANAEYTNAERKGAVHEPTVLRVFSMPTLKMPMC